MRLSICSFRLGDWKLTCRVSTVPGRGAKGRCRGSIEEVLDGRETE